MAFLNFIERSRTNWTPASYTADETAQILLVNAGELIGPVWARTRVVFNGTGTDAIVILGAGADTDRFIADGNVDEITTGRYIAQGGSGSVYAALGHHLYTAADTVDVVFTANTAGTRTTGAVDFHLYVARLEG